MREELLRLVRDGLNRGNFDRIIQICEGLFGEKPSLYGTLWLIFRDLNPEWEDQGVPEERYQQLVRALQTPIVDLLQSENASHSDFLQKLDKVLLAFKTV